MGSRYGGLKQIDPMGPSGETILDYSVYDAMRSGFRRVVFVIRRDFENEFRNAVGCRYEGLLDVGYAFQSLDDLPGGFTVPEGRSKPWGTAHAIWAAREAVRDPFLAINADDFYGAPAYHALANHLATGSDEAAMAGYRLSSTLSMQGSVSRGVCQVAADGRLLGVREFTKLVPAGSGARDEKEGVEFVGDESVSMNFWGFHPVIFPLLGRAFESFLACRAEEPGGEFYIPSAVADLVAAGELTVRVLPTDSEWFGVTYREDKPLVQARLARLVHDGDYPSPLFPGIA
ncbi:MAG: nucleotidyltransferase [Terrimicrobiaceae bacterium]